MKFSIVIPTYNHCSDLLQPCVNSILEYTDMQDVELVISANGCTDETREYLTQLIDYFYQLNLPNNLKIAWSDAPTGYSKSTNDGIKISTGDKLILLNNDVFILDQPKNTWINLLNRQFELDDKCGVSGPSKVFSDPAGRNFLIFFCVMIDRKVFNEIGLLNEEYGKGGGEDTEFCILAENAGYHLNICAEQIWDPEMNLYVGGFPIYHRGEGTVHDKTLVPDYDEVFEHNSLLLAKKFNPEWYRWKISNNSERAVYLKGHKVDIREQMRYSWAAEHMTGTKLLDVGCSSGYGAQFFTPNIEYVGVDYDERIIAEATEQNWLPEAKFLHTNLKDFNSVFNNTKFDTIVAFEVIEHLQFGFDFIEQAKQHCDHLIISVPYNEPVETYNPHHALKQLKPENFTDFRVIGCLTLQGELVPESQITPNGDYSLMLEWKKEQTATSALYWLNDKYPAMYNEIIKDNCYDLNKSKLENKCVIDIGANIGAFSLLANFYGANKIIAVEPAKRTFLNLITNTCGTNNVIALPFAVTDKTGDTVDININEDDFNNSLYLIKSDQFEKVATISLPDLLKFAGTNQKIFLKIDCEGSEFDILAGATKTDFENIDDVIIEVHTNAKPEYPDDSFIVQTMTDFGFKLDKAEQMFSYSLSEDGQPINVKELPAKVQFWSK